nr:hypothetical protein [Cereibacter changlensis]
MDINRPVIGRERSAQTLFGKLRPRHDATSIRREHFQQTEFRPRQVKGQAMPSRSAGRRVHNKHSRRQRLGTDRRPPACATENCAAPRGQLAGRTGFGEIVVGPEVEACDAIDFITTGSQHQDRNGAFAADPAQDLYATYPWHHDVEDNDLWLRIGERGEAAAPVGEVCNGKAFLLEVFGKELGELGVIVNEQNWNHRRTSILAIAPPEAR